MSESKIAKDLYKDNPSPSERAGAGSYTRSTAKKRVQEFKENANRQLALTKRQRIERAAQHQALRLGRRVLARPGSGLPIWFLEDVAEDAVEQIRLTKDWKGQQLANRSANDSEIANDYALRPQARPGPETLSRQCEYSKAAAIMVRILEIVGIKREMTGPRDGLALELVPALLEEYLMLCGIGTLRRQKLEDHADLTRR